MDDWDEPVPSLIKKEQPRNLWDDEDVDEGDIKDSWEEDDEPAPASAPAPTPAPPPEKTPKKATSATKAADKKVKASGGENEAPVDPVAEKLRQQRLVEEADYKSTIALFSKKGDEKTLENFIPKSESDFQEYAELVFQKLRPYEKSFQYIGLLKAVMRLSMIAMKAANAKEIALSVQAIANEKLKAEKKAQAGKKKTEGPKKKQLHLGIPDDDLVFDAYDGADDYDSM